MENNLSNSTSMDIADKFALKISSAWSDFSCLALFIDGALEIKKTSQFSIEKISRDFHQEYEFPDANVLGVLARSFIMNVVRSYRIFDAARNHLYMNRSEMKDFRKLVEPLVVVRNTFEHAFDPAEKRNVKKKTPQLHSFGGMAAVDETSCIVINGTILIGPIDVMHFGRQFHHFYKIAGFSGLRERRRSGWTNDQAGNPRNKETDKSPLLEGKSQLQGFNEKFAE